MGFLGTVSMSLYIIFWTYSGKISFWRLAQSSPPETTSWESRTGAHAPTPRGRRRQHYVSPWRSIAVQSELVPRFASPSTPLWMRCAVSCITWCMRVRVRPGGLASFDLRVSSDCDAGSLARGVRRYCCRLVFFMRHHLRFGIRVVLLFDP